MKARKSWTFKQAWAAQERFRLEGGTVRGPFFQWVALHELDELKRRFVAGDSYALMLAMRKCANHDLVMPDWLAQGYIRAFDTVHNYRAKSWDGVFGNPLPKNAQLAARRKKLIKSGEVWKEVQQRLGSELVWNETKCRYEPKIAIDDELFAEVGEKLGLGLTLTKEYYSERKRRMGGLLTPRVRKK